MLTRAFERVVWDTRKWLAPTGITKSPCNFFKCMWPQLLNNFASLRAPESFLPTSDINRHEWMDMIYDDARACGYFSYIIYVVPAIIYHGKYVMCALIYRLTENCGATLKKYRFVKCTTGAIVREWDEMSNSRRGSF